MTSTILLLVFSGLPGAGKSQLAGYLKSLSQADSTGDELSEMLSLPEGSTVSVSVVSFDQEYCALLANNTSLESNGEASFQPSLWHESRQVAINHVRELVRLNFDEEKKESDPAQPLPSPNSMDDTSKDSAQHLHLIIVDDNNQYRSMRKVFYQMARDARIAFGQLHLSVSIDTALVANSNRPKDSRVEDETILKMASAFQLPQPNTNSWEQASVTVPMDGVHHGLTSISDVIPWSDLATFWLNVPDEVESDLERQRRIEREREVTGRSFLHQLELGVRASVSQFIKKGRSRNAGYDASSFKKFVSKVQSQKRVFMLYARSATRRWSSACDNDRHYQNVDDSEMSERHLQFVDFPSTPPVGGEGVAFAVQSCVSSFEELLSSTVS